MDIVNFTPFQSLAGGLLIGVATASMWLLLGRITGISGITGGLISRRQGDTSWRATFVAGLVFGGLVFGYFQPQAFQFGLERSWPTLVVAGLLVGLGTQLGSGCTSGHGICGIGRASPRGITATMTFMATGAIVAFLVNNVFGGAL